jgi:cysteine desulfurase family protein (TIGR01976 family)
MPDTGKSPHQTGLDLSRIRRRFPSLRQKVNGRSPIYLDNPGGTQVPASVIDAMRRYLVEANSNSHGAFHTSELTDQTIEAARVAMADLLNAPSPHEIVFGPNMTTLTFHISRAIGQTLSKGDEIIVTRMDHDANIAPWLLTARDRGLTVRWVDFDPESGLLDLNQMEGLISTKTKLVACGYASNALGTINNVAKITEMARAVGAMTYIDAVHYAPHGPIDVQALGCDFLVCSAYKFFGPHVGILYGKQEHLVRLPAYKVRPAPDQIPDRWETGTLNHEGLAGVTAAVEYLDWIGTQFGEPFNALVKGLRGRKRRLKLALLAIRDYERTLSQHLLDGLSAIEGVNIAGITAPALFNQRVPTVIFSVAGKTPRQVASALGKAGIYVWDGNYYALSVMETLGREEHGGMVRVGAVHYNTHRETARFLAVLEQIVGERLKVVSAGPAKGNASPKGKKKADSPPDILA